MALGNGVSPTLASPDIQFPPQAVHTHSVLGCRVTVTDTSLYFDITVRCANRSLVQFGFEISDLFHSRVHTNSTCHTDGIAVQPPWSLREPLQLVRAVVATHSIMGCGASSEKKRDGDDAPARAAYAASDVPSISSEELLLYHDFETRTASAGEPCDEPSQTRRSVRETSIVTRGRLMHGVTDDLNQYNAALDTPEFKNRDRKRVDEWLKEHVAFAQPGNQPFEDIQDMVYYPEAKDVSHKTVSNDSRASGPEQAAASECDEPRSAETSNSTAIFLAAPQNASISTTASSGKWSTGDALDCQPVRAPESGEFDETEMIPVTDC